MSKLVVLVRQDLRLPKGKLAVQVAHAAVECVLKASEDDVEPWLDEGGTKIVLKVAGRKELFKYKKAADDSGLNNVVIADAGKTTVPPGTITCLGIGPDEGRANRCYDRKSENGLIFVKFFKQVFLFRS